MDKLISKILNLKVPLIIGMSGKKQSGKDTLCNDIKKYFDIKFLEYCSHLNCSKICKIYSFADLLKKNICMDVLGLTYEQCNGTDEQKNTLTKYKWEDMFLEILDRNSGFDYKDEYYREYKKGYMTAREIMQVVGTNIFREHFDKDIWAHSTINKINEENYKIAIINDARFCSEINCLIEEKAIIIRLLRNANSYDTHQSEVDLDYYDWSKIDDNRFCIVKNTDMTKEEQFNFVLDFLLKNNVN